MILYTNTAGVVKISKFINNYRNIAEVYYTYKIILLTIKMYRKIDFASTKHNIVSIIYFI